ncbi:hypothetical protein [Janthinobacterium sp. UMAB-56]|uniref:hypothetical protein n=1 Tax=Janthinobacterium sp. UMAB-56 TaxID=1365361 RepID=UPI001C562D30|nr:hypothetical protein [Janthinobacterium sp. UMAB-56]
MSNGNMREQMPQVAAIIDAFREAFGAKEVDAAIRRGMRGGQGFHATEGGHEVGTPIARGVRIGTDERGNRINLDDPQANIPEPYVRRMGEMG